MLADLEGELAQAGLEIIEREEGLVLTGKGMSLRVDFADLLPRISHDRLQRELVVRAARIRGLEGTPILIDATAGLGEDSFLLAASGFDAMLFERDPVIASMLVDAVERARQDERMHEIAMRMHVICADAIEGLSGLASPPDVVYLDPMFPHRTKSAAVKKKFQLLHLLERPCDDERALLDAAIGAHPRKIIIKRPVKGPYLADVKPSHSLAGKAVRYDCLAFSRES